MTTGGHDWDFWGTMAGRPRSGPISDGTGGPCRAVWASAGLCCPTYCLLASPLASCTVVRRSPQRRLHLCGVCSETSLYLLLLPHCCGAGGGASATLPEHHPTPYCHSCWLVDMPGRLPARLAAPFAPAALLWPLSPSLPSPAASPLLWTRLPCGGAALDPPVGMWCKRDEGQCTL